MQRLYFVRHGLSVLNVKGLFAGQTETPLTDEGRLQAKQAGEYAKTLHIDYIMSSPLSRALDTAKIIAIEIGFAPENIDVNTLVIERGFGELEGKPWAPDLNIDGFADIETHDSLLERAKLTLEHLQTVSAANILIVSHSGFGRAMRYTLNPSVPFRVPPRLNKAEVIQLI